MGIGGGSYWKAFTKLFVATILEAALLHVYDSVAQPHLQMWPPIHRCIKQLPTFAACSWFNGDLPKDIFMS